MEYNELSPLAINIVGFRQQMKALFDAQGDPVGEQRSERQSVSVRWPGCDIPELDDVLGDDADSVSSIFNGLQRVASIPVMWIVSIDSTNKDVRIDQDIHLALVVLGVDSLSRESVIRQNRKPWKCVDDLLQLGVPIVQRFLLWAHEYGEGVSEDGIYRNPARLCLGGDSGLNFRR